MQSRKKWKHRYYKERKAYKELKERNIYLVIEKSLIKEKIEELNEMIIEVHKGNLQRYTVSEMLSFIRFCEELLGE